MADTECHLVELAYWLSYDKHAQLSLASNGRVPTSVQPVHGTAAWYPAYTCSATPR